MEAKFPWRWCKSLLPGFIIPQRVPNESCFRFRDSPLHNTDHFDKSCSHVSVRDSKSTSATTERLCSTGCHFSITFGQRVNRFRFLTSDPVPEKCVFYVSGFVNAQNSFTLAGKSRKEFIQHEFHGESHGLLCCARQWSKTAILP